MIPEITELNFPAYATLSSATATIADMGEKTITADVKVSGAITPNFSFDWAVMFKGNKYIQPLRTPQGAKDNISLSSSVNLTFQHWAIYQLKRYYFVELTSIQSGTAIADKYIASISLNLGDFVTLLNNNLSYYFGNTISVQLNPNWEYSTEVTTINISYSYLWDVIQQIYELFAVRWTIEPTNANGDTYVIKIGYDATVLTHTFQYGYDGGLMKIERQVQSAEIRNELLGRGGNTNLPKYYFKAAPANSDYASDPDANEELANIYFSELRGKTFRDYVKGWNNAHHGGASMVSPTWAYTCGKTDTTFNPIEYVKDDESISKYGVLIGGIDNQEDIFPSIQGAPNDLDKVVAVEEVTSDDVYETSEINSVVSNVGGATVAVYIFSYGSGTLVARGGTFIVPENQSGVLTGTSNIKVWKIYPYEEIDSSSINVLSDSLTVYNSNGETVSSINIPSGTYYYTYTASVSSNLDYRTKVVISYESVKLTTSDENTDAWKPTFDIWIKNIWNTTKGASETAQGYADRVWIPILNEDSKVSFSSGALSVSEDYEFAIHKYAYNEDANIDAEWILTLVKSDAEAETSGIWIPSVAYQAAAGDGFYFTGIDMPQQYVEWAEERLDGFKTDELNKNAAIQPTYSVELDSVRVGTKQGTDTSAIIDQLETGAQLTLSDSRFLSSDTQLYITDITYTWSTADSSNAVLTPKVQITLSNDIAVVKNPISLISGDVYALQKQVGSISNIQQIVRAIGDKLYLRKDGLADKSFSETQFVSKVTGSNFREGIVGGADWGITRDYNGNSVAEFDIIKARKELQVNNLVVNQISAIGGKEILSSASMTCTQTVNTDGGYVCYFDQKNGTIANLFEVGDVAMSQVFDADNTQTKYYKRRVVAVNVNSITLSKTVVNGSGVPSENDVIVQYGSYTNVNRQDVIIRDVIGGGNERMISGLNSVDAAGDEYYFAGRIKNGLPRWFVGNKNSSYIKYDASNNSLDIRANVVRIGSANVQESIDAAQTTADNASDAVAQEEQERLLAINNVNGSIAELQAQVDGEVSNWFFDYSPSIDNYPANTWTTDVEKDRHIGDTFTNSTEYVDNATTPDAGKSWRWMYTDTEHTGYHWHIISDSDAVKALQEAAKAQATADGKSTTFTVQPSNYQVGDMWILASDRTLNSIAYKTGDLLTANAASAVFVSSHWSKEIRYTDNTVADEAISLLSDIASDDKLTPDEKQATKKEWEEIQIEEPKIVSQAGLYNLSVNQYVTAYNYLDTYLSDLLADLTTTSDIVGTTFRAKFNDYYTYREDLLNLIATTSKALTDGKSTTFTVQPTTSDSYKVGDMWVNATYSDNNVTYSNELLRCKTAKASGASFSISHWEKATRYDNTVATFENGVVTVGSLQLAGDEGIIKAGAIGSGGETAVRFWAGAAAENRSAAPFRVLQNGNIVATNADISGVVNATSGTFEDVDVKGSFRSPFQLTGDSFTPTHSDNAVVGTTGGWAMSYILPWTADQSGRKITITNYKWGSTIYSGGTSTTAPTGQYFFENGIAKSELNVNRELVELIGYGDSTTFYGWIVVNRIDLMPTKAYGRGLKVLAIGKFTGASTTAGCSISAKTYDGSTFGSPTRISEGKYKIPIPSAWGLTADNYVPILTGYGFILNSTTSPAKATIQTIYSTYFIVNVSDNQTNNDGSFYFLITNLADWA